MKLRKDLPNTIYVFKKAHAKYVRSCLQTFKATELVKSEPTF